MQITGHLLIGNEDLRGTAASFKACDPARAIRLEPAFGVADAQAVDRACTLAAAAFDTYRETAPEARARFLETIAAEIEALGDALIERAMAETALPRARLEGDAAWDAPEFLAAIRRLVGPQQPDPTRRA